MVPCEAVSIVGTRIEAVTRTGVATRSLYTNAIIVTIIINLTLSGLTPGVGISSGSCRTATVRTMCFTEAFSADCARCFNYARVDASAVVTCVAVGTL